MLWTSPTAHLSGPILTNPDKWASYQDVPVDQMQEGIQYGIGFQLTIDPEGRTVGCQIVVTSGDPRLDAYSCNLARHRMHFTPAKAADASPAYGTYRSDVTWWMSQSSGPPPLKHPGDIEMSVNRLPENVKSPATVRLMFAVAADGQISSCASEPGADPQLGQIACATLVKSLHPAVVVDSSGTRVPSIQNIEVRFSTQPR